MKKKQVNGTQNHSGSTFDSFLEEEGIREEVEAVAVKRILAWQLEQAMTQQQKTKQAMARELRTSRSQLDRLLDPQNTAVTIDTVTRAAHVLGKRLVLRITEPGRVRKPTRTRKQTGLSAGQRST
jgi:antitoxin HicB